MVIYSKKHTKRQSIRHRTHQKVYKRRSQAEDQIPLKIRETDITDLKVKNNSNKKYIQKGFQHSRNFVI